jgi:hypothetical protein
VRQKQLAEQVFRPARGMQYAAEKNRVFRRNGWPQWCKREAQCGDAFGVVRSRGDHNVMPTFAQLHSQRKKRVQIAQRTETRNHNALWYFIGRGQRG